MHRALIDLVKAAVRQSMDAIVLARRETLAGYALLTDDELSTLAHLAVTQEALRARTNKPDLIFSPTNWPYLADGEMFREASERLRDAAARAQDLGSHVDASFAGLVKALAELKAEGTFGPGAYLTVLSTDPSDYLLELERGGVRQLNDASIVAARERYLAKFL